MCVCVCDVSASVTAVCVCFYCFLGEWLRPCLSRSVLKFCEVFVILQEQNAENPQLFCLVSKCMFALKKIKSMQIFSKVEFVLFVFKFWVLSSVK